MSIEDSTMASIRRVTVFCFLLVVQLGLCSAAVPRRRILPPFNRSSFPRDFVFGAASAAYQVEGGAKEGGRGPSIWDTFTHTQPDKIWDRATGDVAIDFYHRHKSDILALKSLGMDAFRFSISWSRILPTGKVSGGVNQAGIEFYNSVIDEVVSNGMKPFVTLFHWDTPQALEDEFEGFLSADIVNYYRDYVDVCFKSFGDRVKHWITLNEPLSYTMNGYCIGTFAPGRCSNYDGKCAKGNSGTEPYIVAHHLLLCHSAAVQLYREKYQKSQKGEIGVTLVTHWFMPKSDTIAAVKAAYRVLDFFLGWFLHPITYGTYPPSMVAYVGDRLPKFTPMESKMLKGSIDFLGMNYYTSRYVSPALSYNRVNVSWSTDPRTTLSTSINGIPIGTPTALDWLFNCPKGIRSLMLYIKDKYNNPPVYITENGMADKNNATMPINEALEDEMRIKYFEGHLWFLKKAIEEGANVKGHFAWSLLDSFEWDAGLTVRFGLYYVDYKDGLNRHPKTSAIWFKKFLERELK